MADMPQSDLSRVVSHEPDQSWPTEVKITLTWKVPIVPGRTAVKTVRRDHTVSGDEFYGRGRYGAPMSGQSLVSAIERLRKTGPK